MLQKAVAGSWNGISAFFYANAEFHGYILQIQLPIMTGDSNSMLFFLSACGRAHFECLWERTF